MTENLLSDDMFLDNYAKLKEDWYRKMEQQAEEEKKQRIQRLFDFSRLGERFKNSTFDRFEPLPGTEKALKYAKEFAENFLDHLEKGTGLIIFGEPGNGKTHLVAAVVHKVISQGKTAIFQWVPDLLDRIKRTYGKNGQVEETEDEILRAVNSVDLLVLDDLGAEQWTQWTEGKMTSIIEHRYRFRKPILVTTNCQVQELKKVISFRAYDRLLEMCLMVENSGSSYRRKVAKERLKQMRGK